MIRLLHTADLHLDWSFPTLAPHLRAIRRRELIAVFDALIKSAIEREVQAVVISGGIFQGSPPPINAFLAVSEGFARLAARNILVFIAPSTEETAQRIFELLSPADNVILLGGDFPTIHQDLQGLTVYGFPPVPIGHPPLRGFYCLNQVGLHLAVIHGTYKDLAPDDASAFSPVTAEEIAHSGLDYLALGGHHESFVCQHGGTAAAYPGSPAHLDFGQEDDRGAWLVGLTEGRPEMERIILPSRRFLEFTYDLSQTTLPEIEAELAGRADPEACVNVVLNGVTGAETGFLDEDLRAAQASLFFSLTTENRTLLKPPGDGKTLGHLFYRRLDERLNRPDLREHERTIITDALRAGLDALERGRGLA